MVMRFYLYLSLLTPEITGKHSMKFLKNPKNKNTTNQKNTKYQNTS